LHCNPAHVFHRECIESFVFCPECFAPIDNELPESFLDDRSERPAHDESDEEHLLANGDIDQQAADGEERKEPEGREVTFQFN